MVFYAFPGAGRSRTEQIAARVAARRLGMGLSQAVHVAFTDLVRQLNQPELAADPKRAQQFAHLLDQELAQRNGRYVTLHATDVDPRRNGHPGEALVTVTGVYHVALLPLLDAVLHPMGLGRVASPPASFGFAAAYAAGMDIDKSGEWRSWPSLKLLILATDWPRQEVRLITGGPPEKAVVAHNHIDVVRPRSFDPLPGHKMQVVFRSRFILLRGA